MIINNFLAPESYPLSMNIIDLEVPTANFRDVSLFHVNPLKIVAPSGVPLEKFGLQWLRCDQTSSYHIQIVCCFQFCAKCVLIN
jgi:hypothetical protein